MDSKERALCETSSACLTAEKHSAWRRWVAGLRDQDARHRESCARSPNHPAALSLPLDYKYTLPPIPFPNLPPKHQKTAFYLSPSRGHRPASQFEVSNTSITLLLPFPRHPHIPISPSKPPSPLPCFRFRFRESASKPAVLPFRFAARVLAPTNPRPSPSARATKKPLTRIGAVQQLLLSATHLLRHP